MNTVTRPAGRPRDASRDDAIMEAALELVSEAGFSGLSIEAIAARAGVGKATIYRRWATKAEIVFDAWERCVPPPGQHGHESVRDELISVYAKLAADLSSEPMRSILPHVLARSSVDEAFEDRIRSFIALRRENTLNRLRQAIAGGEMDSVGDLDGLVDRLTGPVFYRLMVRRLEVDSVYVASVVDAAIGSYLIR